MKFGLAQAKCEVTAGRGIHSFQSPVAGERGQQGIHTAASQHCKGRARTRRFCELHAAYTGCFGQDFRGARVFLERGHAFDFDEDGNFGQRGIRNRIAHEYIGSAMYALFQRSVPGLADSRRVQRPAPGPTVGDGVAVSHQDTVGAQALCSRERRLRRNVAGSWKIQRLGARVPRITTEKL